MTAPLPKATRRSRYLFAWDAASCLAALDQVLDASTGQVATFSRASTKTALDANGALRIVPDALPAFQWTLDPVSGLMTPGVLLEDTRTNATIYSEQINNAAWVKTESSVTADASASPSGTTTADKLIESVTAAVEHYVDFPTIPATSATTIQSASIFAKAGERTWIHLSSINKAGTVVRTWFNLATGAIGTAGHTATITKCVSGWYRCAIVFDSGTGASTVRVVTGLATGDTGLAYNGDGASGVYLWGGQFEADKPIPSSYIPTTTVAVPRSADALSYAYNGLPQAMSAYAKGQNLGTCQLNAAALDWLWQIGVLANTGRLVGYWNGTGFSVFLSDAAGATKSALVAVAPSHGDTVEVLCTVTAAGVLQVTVSVNGATAVVGAASTALALPAAWNASTLSLNLADVTPGRFSYQSVRVAAGVQTLATMRAG